MNECKAISETQEMWLGEKGIEKSGLSKDEFLHNTPEGKVWVDKDYASDCPLCVYAEWWKKGIVSLDSCAECPLVKQYNKTCFMLGFQSYANDLGFFEAIRGLKYSDNKESLIARN